MGMTIDTAITVLGMVEAHGICIEAKDIAVDTMRKYQKIKHIINDVPYLDKDEYKIASIKEIIDGKIDC